jgi:hypothetical protein
MQPRSAPGRSPRLALLAVLAVLAVIAACTSTAPTPGPTGIITGSAMAGPTCPVESDPPDPNCEPRPVAAAVIVATDAAGNEVARTQTGGDGRFSLTVPHGRWQIRAEPRDDYFAVSEPIEIDVDATDIARVVDFTYDTGIR